MAIIWSLFILSLITAESKHNPKIGGRIVGGEATTIEEYPHQVSIIYLDSHACGGSIIAPQFILTAAHCTDGVSAGDLLVRAGSSIVDEGGQVKQVEAIYQHPNYDSDIYDYDISVLKLSEPVTLGDGVAVITLPSQDSDVPGNLLGTATGWGRLYEDGPLPMQLQKVDIPTLDAEICQLVYGNQYTDREFCAGYIEGKKDACQGDSGGPFVADGILLGIVSWGDGCGSANSPGVYTKVSYFASYINNIINS